MNTFDLAQTFFLDPALVQNAYEVQVSNIYLYFRNKPLITGNKSGIFSPGVNIFLAPTINGIPDITNQIPTVARCSYGQINIDASAQTPTVFTFDRPVNILTNTSWAILISFDGHEDFQLWQDVTGTALLDANGNVTTVMSPGPSGKYIGQLFSFISSFNIISPPTPTTNTTSSSIPMSSNQNSLSQVSATQAYYLGAWKPINSTELKFQVDIARYSHQGFPVLANASIIANQFVSIVISNNVTLLTNNSIRITSPCYPTEFLNYDLKSSQTAGMKFGDFVYQYQPYWPGGTATPATISVNNTSPLVTINTAYLLANGANANFSQLYNFSIANSEFIVAISLNHFGPNAHATDIRRITRQVNNAIFVNAPFSFTNAAAYFYKSPIGFLANMTRPYIGGKSQTLAVLKRSNANSSCRFVNNVIMTSNIVAGGAGYSNSDYITVNGFESVTNEVLGGYSAKANVVTFANGTISAIYFSNVGAGFVNAAAITYTISNSSNQPSTGTGSNLSFTANAILYDRLGNQNTFFQGVIVENFNAQDMIPLIGLNNPLGTTYQITFQSLYYSQPSSNTFSGMDYFLDNVPSSVSVINGQEFIFTVNNMPCIVSRSNQFAIGYANGFIPNTSILGAKASNTAVFFIDMYSNNDFTTTQMGKYSIDSYYCNYNINNDYTLENTNYGNAYAKHVSTMVTLANGQFAEDLIVYLDVIRPQGTDIEVYARLHNSHDNDPFAAKDWTRLELVNGIGVYTSLTNPGDRVDLTYNLRLYPNSGIQSNTTTTVNPNTITGVVSTVLNSQTITGTNTNFNILTSGQLIRIYQPLFPNADYQVAVVNVVTNATSMTINDPITNNSIVTNGGKIDVIGYPLQAFKNNLNDNVARYYTNTGVAFDNYDTCQFKLVLLSPNNSIVPKINNIRAVMVSA